MGLSDRRIRGRDVKTISMIRSFDYRPKRGVIIAYLAETTYRRVPEAAVRAIVQAGAGKVVDDEDQRS